MVLSLKPGLTLYLARHGETQANTENRFSGQRDTPLTDTGRRQARDLGEILKRELGVKPDLNFISSPLARARATMEIALGVLNLPRDGFHTDPRIQEINLGAWDQLTDEEARARDPAYFTARGQDKWHVPAPGGETYEAVAARAGLWAQSLTHDTFAVSHGAVGRILRGLLTAVEPHAIAIERGRNEPQGVVFRIRDGKATRLDP